MVKLKDDFLDEIYLIKKHVNGLDELYRTDKEIFYILENEVILKYPLDEHDTTFKVVNLEYSDYPDKMITEIFVNPNTTDIIFSTYKNYEKKLRFKADFDHEERMWDVRSYINIPNNPSYLQDSLDEVLTLDNGEKEQTSFLNMINTIRKVYKEKATFKQKNR